jgi:hypothetical protein
MKTAAYQVGEVFDRKTAILGRFPVLHPKRTKGFATGSRFSL